MEEIFIRVQVFGAAKMEMGASAPERISLRNSANVGDLLHALYHGYPALQSLLEGREKGLHALILVNSLDIKRLDGIQTILNNDDRVDIISSISGG